MQIAKNYDVVHKGPPNFEQGTGPFENPGIKPRKDIADTPGEKAENFTQASEMNKKQPFGKGGSGYTKD